MRNIRFLILVYVLVITSGLMAQSYTFEDNWNNWTAQQGTLSLSTEHYKEGAKSLCWETEGISTLLISGFSTYSAATTNGAYMQIYSPAFTQDTLVVEFLNSTTVRRTANYLCNYAGWREFSRAYTEYAITATTNITAIRIRLKPASAGVRKIYFDDVQFNTKLATNRVPGCQWVLDDSYMSVNTAPLLLYANSTDLPLTTPTAAELTDLHTLRTRLARSPGYNAVQAIVAKNWVNSNLTLTRNTDGSICGTPIATTASDLTATELNTILDRLVYLAGGAINGSNAEVVTAFNDYLDHLLDQGLGEGCNMIFASNSYTDPGTIIPKILNLIPACNSQQQEQIVRWARWVSHYGNVYYPESRYLANLNSDVVYLYVPYMQVIAAFYPDDAIAVRELRAVQRYLNRVTEYVPGGGDMLKPDGTGFHHNTHYNNYMYAYQSYINAVYIFRETTFQLSEEAYSRFGKAITAVYTMATPGTGDNRFYANSLCGRNPFDSGNKLFFSKANFIKLIDIGTDYTKVQDELKGAYNYFFQTNTYSVSENSFEGFRQFNYSPMGIMRKDNWVATMRAPTSKLWGAEIYSGANRFGRYQSHGSLEITYQGNNLLASGYPTNGTGGGWDWNVIPGTTTVHYTSWADMMPSANTTARFDQYTKGTNFSGAVGMGNCGLFACNFDQIDTWGAQRFTPTNLVFKKSVFVFDSILVALGSDISASGSYSDDMITATNLFQNIVGVGSGTFTVNGTTPTQGYTEILDATQANWMVTPAGTGYLLPAGNDALTVKYASQTTPKETGADYASPTTSLTAAKAYINHGIKTSGKSYEFIVIPNVTSAQMQTFATQYAAKKPYTVESKTSSLHAVSCGNITAYAFFAAVDNLNFGIVKSTTNQHLLIDKVDTSTGRHAFAVCNPNLNPATDATYGWVSTPTTTIITLKGEYKAMSYVENVNFATPVNGETEVTVTMTDGEPVYFTAILSTDVSTVSPVAGTNLQFIQQSDKILIKSVLSLGNITLLTAAGQVVSHTVNNQSNAEISIAGLPQGVYVCHTDNGIYKFIK